MDMKRSTAREIAMHFSFELAYNDAGAAEALRHRFSDEYFPGLSGEDEIYTESPTKTLSNT